MYSPTFSFIMPAYKAKFLHKAIDSILKQTFRDFELVIINDASPEQIETIVRQFPNKRIRYEENKTNIGGKDLVANWNHCIQFAKNDYIILATDDDMFEPDFLKSAVSMIEKYPSVDLIRSGVKKIDEQEKILDIEFPLKEYMTCQEFTLFWAKGGTISCVSNYIYRKTALKDGFISFPHAHLSDDATALLLSRNGVACMPENNMNFRVSTINLSNQSNYKLALEQLHATELFMTWYCEHIKQIDMTIPPPDEFFGRACYGYYKGKYKRMMENLTSKIPLSKINLAFRTIFSDKHLFKKEKCKLFANYIIDKL